MTTTPLEGLTEKELAHLVRLEVAYHTGMATDHCTGEMEPHQVLEHLRDMRHEARRARKAREILARDGSAG